MKRDSNQMILNPVIGSIKSSPSLPAVSATTTTSLSPLSNPSPFNSSEHSKERRRERKGFDFANLAKSVLDEDGEGNKSSSGHHSLPSKPIYRIFNGTSNGHLPQQGNNVPNSLQAHQPPVHKKPSSSTPSHHRDQPGSGGPQPGPPPPQPPQPSSAAAAISGQMQLPAVYHDYIQKQLAFFAAASAASGGGGHPFIPGFPFPPT